jgi:pimeloyl-ACP methyl ester carboxylesterase
MGSATAMNETTTTFTEQTCVIGPNKSLVGILTVPDRITNSAVLFLNAGMLHRVGPNRCYVKWARQLAELGYPVLRLDASGLGDSGISDSNEEYDERMHKEIAEAMQTVRDACGSEQFILAGMCLGAVNALLIAPHEPQVCGVVMQNPQFLDEDELTAYVEARNWMYWKRVLFNTQRWKEFFTGKANYEMIRERLRGFFVRKHTVNEIADQFIARFGGLINRGTRILMVNTAFDVSQDYLEVMLRDRAAKFSASGGMMVKEISDCDHIFTTLDSQQEFLDIFKDWAANLPPPGRAQ